MLTRRRLGWLLVVCAAVLVSTAAQGAEITIVAPEAGQEVSGAVRVAVTITLAANEVITTPVAQGLDGRQVPLFADGEGGYVGEIDTTQLPNGRQSLVVFATPLGRDAWREEYADESWGEDRHISRAEVRILVRNPYRFCWGDLHAHTSYSDGGWYPSEAYQYARDEAKLDFFAITDHEEILTRDEYADVIAQADRFDEPGRFVALYGVERSNGETGHFCYYMSPTYLLPSNLNDFYRTAGANDLLGHFNHPWKPGPDVPWVNDFEGFRYSPEADRVMAMVEVRGLEEEACYIAMLDNGWHVGTAGDKDAHAAEWGQGPTWTVALAKELTREGILEALWARRTYSTADRNMMLDFSLDGEDMGAQVSRPAGDYRFSVAVGDPDQADVVEKVDVFLDGRIVAEKESTQSSHIAFADTLTLPPGNHYCFVRVTQAGEKGAWSSPIWVSAYESAPEPAE